MMLLSPKNGEHNEHVQYTLYIKLDSQWSHVQLSILRHELHY